MGVMINNVRNTVLAIANKNNYGYVSPQDFNLYAQQAQMDLFEDYFYQYNSWITKQNARVSGTGYADIVKSLVEVIDSFSVTKSLQQQASNFYNLPADYYYINKVNYYPNYVAGATTTGSATNKLVVSVDSETQLTLSANPFGVAATVGNSYAIFKTNGIVEVERVNQNKIFYLNNSPLTAPSLGYPAYVLGGATTNITGDASTGQLGNTITVYPTSITQNGSVSAEYIRYPLPPKWTYLTVGGTSGSPEFDSSQADYQDFELPQSDEPGLVAKICQYIGIEIREADVYQFGKQEILENNQTES